jgi:RNA polymerase sigma-70 factor (ECF subfamily)
VSKQVLSGNLEDGSDTGRRASGEQPSPAPLETGASDPLAEAAERDRRLGALVHANYPLLWRTLRRLGVAEAEIDDALEEVFLVALRRLDGIGEDRERAFLLGLALRAASTRCGGMGRRREQGELSLGEPADALCAPEQLADRQRARALLDEILGGMGLKSRTVFVLLELEGLGALEIAELLEIPPETVGPRVRRARESFRRMAARHQLGSPLPRGPVTTGLYRMLDEGASPIERWLLESAEQDVPPEDGPRTLIRTLGVDSSLACVNTPSTSGMASHAGVRAVTGSGGVARAVASKSLLVIGAKWLGAGLLAGALMAGALRLAGSPEVPRAPATRTPAPPAEAALAAEKPKKPVSSPATLSAEKASQTASVPARPLIRSGFEGSRTEKPELRAEARATAAVRRRAVAAPSASRRPARPKRSEPAARRTLQAPAPPRPSTSTAGNVAAFPDG